MQLGSYQTAWAMLHRYRSVMVRPGRDRLTGDVEVEEAFLGSSRSGRLPPSSSICRRRHDTGPARTVLTVDDLLRSGRLEVVPADRATALVRLARAEQHLETATALVGHDNEVAYGSLYVAVRKAVTALRLANGFRVPD